MTTVSDNVRQYRFIAAIWSAIDRALEGATWRDRQVIAILLRTIADVIDHDGNAASSP